MNLTDSSNDWLPFLNKYPPPASEPSDSQAAHSHIDDIHLSTNTYNWIIYVLIGVAIITSILGAIANALIIAIYKKMGLCKSPSINISYISMAVSDLMICMTTLPWAILIIPNFDSFGLLPVVSKEILIMVGMQPALAFNKTTACITAWVAVERCLCVVFPFKVKVWVTHKLTAVVIAIIYCSTIAPMLLFNVVFRYEWKTSKLFPNTTVLGVRRVDRPGVNKLYDTLLIMYGLIYQWIPLSIITICTAVLIIYLKRLAKKQKIMRRPSQFRGPMLFNSCFNIFIYYSLGTRFRKSLRKVLHMEYVTETSTEFTT